MTPISPSLYPYLTAGIIGWFNPTIDTASLSHVQSVLTTSFYNPRLLMAKGACCAVTDGGILEDDHLIILFAGRIRYKTVPANDIQSTLRALANDYRQVGAQILQQLFGSFAFVILDRSHNSAILAIDRIGLQSLYYTSHPDNLLFATSMAALIQLGHVDTDVDLQAIYNYLYCHMIPSPRTVFQNVRKLPASHYLEWRNGECQVKPYWLPHFSETPIETAVTGCEMLEVIETCVRREIDAVSDSKISAFLSGGIDSSTVVGLLARATGAADTYSIGFAVPGYDEMEYARIAVSHFNANPHEYYVTPDDVVTWLPLLAAATDEPFGNSSLLPAFCCARFAREQGVTRLLGGDGGDELFAGNERYAKQGVFGYFNRLPRWLQTVLIAATKPLAPIPLARKAHSYVSQARIPLPDRMDSYAFLERHAPVEVFSADFLAQVDTAEPLALKRAAFRTPEHASDLNRMLYLDWHFTLHDNDLVKINTACRLAGVEIAYPLLDDDLVALSCRIPSAQKLRGGTLRWFYKQATKGFLPDAILNKKKHGFGLPFGIWTRSDPRLLAITDDALESLKQRGWLQPAFLDRARQLHREAHANYYGEMVWILTMLELWLRANVHRAAPVKAA